MLCQQSCQSLGRAQLAVGLPGRLPHPGQQDVLRAAQIDRFQRRAVACAELPNGRHMGDRLRFRVDQGQHDDRQVGGQGVLEGDQAQFPVQSIQALITDGEEGPGQIEGQVVVQNDQIPYFCQSAGRAELAAGRGAVDQDHALTHQVSPGFRSG